MTEKKDPDSLPKHVGPGDFPAGRFRAHGNFESLIDESCIVRSVSTGPYNEEMSVIADKARRALFSTFKPGQAFAVITVVKHSALASRGTIDMTGRCMKALRAEGIPLPRAVAWVIADEVEGKSLMAPHFEQCFADAGILFRVMDDEPSAELWVREMMRGASVRV